jgi:thiol-disulfide isomerase/thioredoxin
MTKSMFTKGAVKLNQMVEKNKEMLLIAFCVIAALLLVKNMFTLPVQRVEGFSSKREIIYFHMTECGHCKKFNPEWEKFVQGTEMPNQKINASSGDPLIDKLGVSGYPTVIVIEGGNKVETFEGERTSENLLAFAKKHA